jgi:lipoate-protein ligase A
MVTPATRQQIHQLIDEANDNQLDIVLEVLQPSSSRYTEEEINSFNQRIQQFEENGSKGYSVQESHELIRNKFKQHGL